VLAGLDTLSKVGVKGGGGGKRVGISKGHLRDRSASGVSQVYGTIEGEGVKEGEKSRS